MSAASIPTSPALGRTVPPSLENGDHLTRQEFERRYARLPHIKRAELVEGVVHMPSPVRANQHSLPHGRLCTWLGLYQARTPGLPHGPADNATVRLDDDNCVQPDLCLLLPRSAGGLAVIDEEDYISGPPALVCEIAASSVSLDLNEKLRAYRRNRVREYLVWRVEDQALDWLIWREGDYAALQSGPDGILRSEAFPGLWLDGPAMLRGDLARVLAVLEQGVATPEHAQFVGRLGNLGV
jgi:hypothetical protein